MIYPTYDRTDKAACYRKLNVCASLRDGCLKLAGTRQTPTVLHWANAWERERAEAEDAILTYHSEVL